MPTTARVSARLGATALLLVVAGGCAAGASSSSGSGKPPGGARTSDACAVLTKAELEDALGVSLAKPTVKRFSENGAKFEQCGYFEDGTTGVVLVTMGRYDDTAAADDSFEVHRSEDRLAGTGDAQARYYEAPGDQDLMTVWTGGRYVLQVSGAQKPEARDLAPRALARVPDAG